MDEVTRLALELAWEEAYEKGYYDGTVGDDYTPTNPYSRKES